MDEHLLFLFSFLDEVEKEIADDAEKQVWIEKCINIKTLSDFTVSCSYGDLVERLAEYENTGLTPEEIHIAMRNLEILEERMKEENDR